MNPIRFSGQWVCAQQGSGKSFALTRMIAKDISEGNSVIVLDSKGDLTGTVRKWAIGERLIVLDPEEPFAICPFDVPKTNISVAADQIIYLFSALLDTAISPMQQSLLRPIIRALIIGHPTPSMETFQEVIYDGMPKEVLANLPSDLTRFFQREWENYARTRSEIKWRLQLLLENDLFRTMFSAPKTKFNIARAMDNGSCVVVDNSQAKLGVYGSAFLGRFFLSRVWSAATQRHLVPEASRHPVCVYVDEAHVLLDQTCAKIIDECRSARIALCLSIQRSSQIPDANVRGALENCAIKMVNVTLGEVDYFSKLLDVPAERMKDLPQGHFATNVRWSGPSIQKVENNPVPFRNMTPQQETALRAKMKVLYGLEKQKPPLEAASRPATETTGGLDPIITPEVTKKVTISVPPGQSPAREQKESDPSKPAPWKRD